MKISTVINSLLIIMLFYLYIYSEEKNNSEPLCPPIDIGIYADSGVGDSPSESINYAKGIMTTLTAIDPLAKPLLLQAHDIHNGALMALDVIIFPGGSGSAQARSLTEEGQRKVIEFVKNGGGYVGICGGAFLARSPSGKKQNYGLKLVKAKLYRDGKYWNRGSGLISITATPEGKKYFPEVSHLQSFYIHYNNGPLFVPKNFGAPRYKKLFLFKSDIYDSYPESRGDTPGKVFLLKAKKGRGIILLISGHAEDTPGMRWILPRMVHIAAQREITQYNNKFVQPKKYHSEIICTTAWKKKEHHHLSIIKKSKSIPRIKESIITLQQMASRKLSKHLPDLLNHRSPRIREIAAKTIEFYDYFPALENLKKAYSAEIDRNTKKKMLQAINSLKK